MAENTDLQGFDMVVSLTQEAIDDEISVVFKDETFDLPWIVYSDVEKAKNADEMKKKKLARLQIDKWYPPYAVFQENRIVRVYFLIEKGFCFYWKMAEEPEDPPTPVYLTMDNWAIRFSVDMNLTDVEGNVGKDKIPQSVRDQLEEFKESMFQVNTLLMDFNNVDLMQSTWEFIPPCELPPSSRPSDIPAYAEEANWEKDKNDNIVQQQLVPIMKNLLARLKGSDHPYVFGYVAQDNNQPREKPTFVPTGTNFSTTRLYPDPVDDSKCLRYPLIPEGHEAGKNTLQYLLMTNNKPVSEGRDGSFKASWVTPGEKGAMVISEELVLKYIADNLVETKQIGNLSLSDFKKSSYEGNPSYFAEIDYPKLKEQTGREIQDPKLQINIVIKGGTNQIVIFLKATGEMPVIFQGCELNTVNVIGKVSIILDFSNPAEDEITVQVNPGESTAFATDTKWYEDIESGALGWYEMVIQGVKNITTPVLIEKLIENRGDFKATFDSTLNEFKGAMQDFSIAFIKDFIPSELLSSNFGSELKNMQTKIILPGGKEFYFKNARFNNERMMILDIAYKD